MKAGFIKPFLTALGLVLALGHTLAAQTPKEAKPATPSDPAAVAKSPKSPGKKPAAPPPANYMLGDAPAPGSKAAKSARPKLGSHAKPKKTPYANRVNLNGASKEELKKLPLMTEEYAAKIIAGRPYRSKAALATDNIVPVTVYFAIKDKVTAGKSTAKK